jgi:hypothetical protein
MKQIVLAGSAVLALLVIPVLTASTADARRKDHPDYGFCQSGAKVKDIKKCKENGGKK